MKYDDRYGGPFDRGGADSYYRRGRHPHYYVGTKGDMTFDRRVEEADMTPEEIEAYHAGFDANEEAGEFKDWG